VADETYKSTAWRCIGFCMLPQEITEDSFRRLKTTMHFIYISRTSRNLLTNKKN